MSKLFKKDRNDDHSSWMSFTDLMSAFLVFFIIASIIALKYYNDSLKQIEDISERLAKFSAPVQSIDSLQVRIDSTIIDIYDGGIIEGDTTIVFIYSKMVRPDPTTAAKDPLENVIREFKCLEGVYADIIVELDTLRGSICLRRKDGGELFKPEEAKPRDELLKFLNDHTDLIITKTMNLLSGCEDLELRIEGHTDPEWGEDYGTEYSFKQNLNLSSERANMVYLLMMNNNRLTPEQIDFMMNHAISVGYSFSERKLAGTHRYPKNMAKSQLTASQRKEYESMDKKSRRIEFRVITR